MKLLRVGAPGAEVPPVLDGGYVARDVSGVASDFPRSPGAQEPCSPLTRHQSLLPGW